MAISQYDNEYYGLSGDVKPLGTPLNGRKFTEMDTRKEYRFDAENQQWLEQSGGGGGSTTLAGLTDVDISNPTDGQTLVYNATSGKWENGSAGEGGGTLIVHWSHDGEHGIYTLDKTWKEIADAMLLGPVLLLLDDIGGGEYSLSSIPIESVAIIDGTYGVSCSQGSFETDSENGYPYYQAD